MKPFQEASYLAKLRRYRKLAEDVIKKYPIKKYDLKFINHGENTTYKITTSNKSYLLRLHRGGYHTKAAISEELKWLKNLSDKSELKVQRPLLSKNGNLIEKQGGKEIPSLYCDILEWQPGVIRYRSLKSKNFHMLGELTASLHKSTLNKKTKYRNYWDTEGLIGRESKYGSFDKMKTLVPKYYSDLEKCRKLVHSKILKYQKQYPNKMSMIHADLHFGNLLWSKDEIFPIDFDDCGYGFHMYDLAVTLCSSNSFFKGKGKRAEVKCKQALLDGYNSVMDISKVDMEMIPYFVLARRISMLTWLVERSDNPNLFNHFHKNIAKEMKVFRKVLKNGPVF